MPSRFALLLLVFTVLIAVPPGAVTQERVAAGQGASPVSDPREHYVVGFSELSPVNLPSEYRYIASTLPRLVAESYDTPMDHQYSEEERTAYAATLLDKAVRSAGRSLSTAVGRRDALLFEKGVTAARRTQAEEAVAAARETYEALLAAGAAETSVPESKSIAFWNGRDAGRLLDPVALDADLGPVPQDLERIAAGADLDLLVWGIVEEIQGYLSVQFFAYSPHEAAMPLSLETAALPSEINQEADLLSDGIAGLLLGRPWGGISVATNVDDAAIMVGDNLVGFGSARVRLLPPGPVTLTVRAQGYRTETRELVVREGETTGVELALQQVVERVVRLESAPGGADVYVDSVWVGQTPLSLTVAAEPRVVRLRAEGYLESRFVLDGDSPGRIARALLPASLDWAEEIRTARDGFYRSLSWFVISVPVTMVLNGMYRNVAGAIPPMLPADTSEEVRRLAVRGNILYWSFWGGLLVNIGLFVNMGINLFEYLNVGEGPHNQ